jgi:hypothetical protein
MAVEAIFPCAKACLTIARCTLLATGEAESVLEEMRVPRRESKEMIALSYFDRRPTPAVQHAER